MQNPSTLLLSLPEDQLSILLSYLALNDVVRLRATCKYLRDVIIPFPEDQLTTIISYLTLNDVLRLRATCDYFRGVTSTATNHLWMDRGEEAERLSRYHTCLHNPYRIGNSRIRDKTNFNHHHKDAMFACNVPFSSYNSHHRPKHWNPWHPW